jgi:hypothetical protein
MSFVIATPDALAVAAQNLTGLGSAIREAHAAAAGSTTVVAAAQDEVSVAIAEVFGRFAQGYHALAAQAAAFQDQFTGNLLAGGNSYAATEAANRNSGLAFIRKHPRLALGSAIQTLQDDVQEFASQEMVVLEDDADRVVRAMENTYRRAQGLIAYQPPAWLQNLRITKLR